MTNSFSKPSFWWWLLIIAVVLVIIVVGGDVQKLIFADAEYRFVEFISCAKGDKYYEIDFKTDNTLTTKYLNTKQAVLDFLRDYEDGKNSQNKEKIVKDCGLEEKGLTGPEEALKFYLWNKDIYKKGIPFSDSEHIKNITPLNKDFYKKEDILKHFLENKGADQIGAAVIIKTEHCFKNQFRPCATATAAFEKESTPLVSRFKLYGHMVPPDSERNQREKWEQDLIKRYGFTQGPGAGIVFLVPECGEWKTDANQLNLLQRPFLDNLGKTPELHKYLEGIIQYWERRVSRQRG